eukprot:312259_1
MSHSNKKQSHAHYLIWIVLLTVFIILTNDYKILPLFLNSNNEFNGVSLTQTKGNKRKLAHINTNLEKSNTLVPLLRHNTNTMIYLKTHKTASSSLTNLLHTLSVRHNKSCPLLTNQYAGHTFDFNKQSNKQIISNINTWNNNTKLDIWLNHAIFNPYLYELIPTSTNQILTIIRNPNDRFLSAWQTQQRHKMNLSTFINNSVKLTEIQQINTNSNKHTRNEFNSQCHEIIPNYADNGIDKYNNWKRIESGDFLILISDRWDESLLLLKYAYNLEWKDLFYKKMTKRPWKDEMKKKKNVVEITQDESIKLKKLNDCDWKLYNVAVEIFDRRLYEIYKDDVKRLEEDIDMMHNVQDAEWHKCFVENTVNFSLVEKQVCESYLHDNREWNKWAMGLR